MINYDIEISRDKYFINISLNQVIKILHIITAWEEIRSFKIINEKEMVVYKVQNFECTIFAEESLLTIF